GIELVPEVLSFGESPVSVPALDIPVTLKNSGNLPITVSIAQPSNSQFSIAWTDAPQALLLQPGATVPGLTGKFTPNAKTSTTATAAITATGPVCGTLPSAITLKGAGAASTAAVQPALLDFGSISCGLAGQNKTVTILNAGGFPFTFSTAFGKGNSSSFSASPPNGTVAANSSTPVTITPAAIPMNG